MFQSLRLVDAAWYGIWPCPKEETIGCQFLLLIIVGKVLKYQDSVRLVCSDPVPILLRMAIRDAS
jgi:hypothetical protein